MSRYEVLEENMPKLEKKLERIRKKCEKYNCDFSYEIVGATHHEIEIDKYHSFIGQFVIVDVEGTAIINGWQLIAKIQHELNGNIITKINIETEIPEKYYYTEPFCEHCNTSRDRKCTYLIRNIETGEFKQVGSACLMDYTHGLSAEMAAACANYFSELSEADKPLKGISYKEYINVKEFLLYAAEAVRCFGYVKTNTDTQTQSTASLTMDIYNLDRDKLNFKYAESLKQKLYKANYNEQSQIEFIDNLLKWAQTLKEENEYLHNVKVLCSLNYIEFKYYGVLASSVIAYKRTLEHNAKKNKDLKSAYQGEIGKKFTFKVKDIECISSWNSAYGFVSMYKMTDETGHIYIWKTSTLVESKKFINKQLICTIKDHSDFNNVKQTIITRCKLLSPSN